MYSVDMAMLFPRKCADADMAGDPGSDFQLWSLHDSAAARSAGAKDGGKGDSLDAQEGVGCVLGRKVDYVRRKPSARCYVGREPIAKLERR